MFDPYHEWLAIPKESRPPTHYQLLGIAPTETNPKVIETACLRQSTFVRAFQKGANAEDATRILTELSEARNVLSDPVRRREYDAKIAPKKPIVEPLSKSKLQIDPSRSSVRTETPRVVARQEERKIVRAVEIDDEEAIVEVVVPKASRTKLREEMRQSDSNAQLYRFLALLGCIAVALIGGIIVIRTISKSTNAAYSPPPPEMTYRNEAIRAEKNQEPKPVPKVEKAPEPKTDPPVEKKIEPTLPKKEDPPAVAKTPPPKQGKLESKGNKEREDGLSPIKESPFLADSTKPTFEFAGRQPRATRRTGFVIGPDLFLTSASLLDRDKNGLYVTVNGEQYAAKVQLESEELDLAILKLAHAEKLKAIPMATQSVITSVSAVTTYGFEHFGPRCNARKLASGTISLERKITWDLPLGASADGGPIFNEKNECIGIIAVRKKMVDGNVVHCCIMHSAKSMLDWAAQLPLEPVVLDEDQKFDEASLLSAIGVVQVRKFPKGSVPLNQSDRDNKFRSQIAHDTPNLSEPEWNQDRIDEALSSSRPRDRRGNASDDDVLKILQQCYPVYRRREAAAIGKRNLDKSMIEISALQVYGAYSDEDVLLRYQKYLVDTHTLRRGLAIEGLGRTRDAKVVSTLVRLLNDRKSGPHWAEKGLRHCGESAETGLITKLKTTKDSQSRAQIIRLLSEIGREESLKYFSELVDDGNTEHRISKAIQSIQDRLEEEKSIEFAPNLSRRGGQFIASEEPRKMAEDDE